MPKRPTPPTPPPLPDAEADELQRQILAIDQLRVTLLAQRKLASGTKALYAAVTGNDYGNYELNMHARHIEARLAELMAARKPLLRRLCELSPHAECCG